MKTFSLLSTALAFAAIVSTAQADINAGYVVPNVASVRGNCDLMASNTVRAKFCGFKNDAAGQQQIADFEVLENLAHRRYVRYGDGPMAAGRHFEVPMDRNMPGQPAEVVDTISKMAPGEETVMRMDHLFLYGEPDGQFLHPCARIARREAPESATPAAPAPAEQGQDSALPTTVAPLTGTDTGLRVSGGMGGILKVSGGNGASKSMSSCSVRIRTVPDGKGGFTTTKEEVRTELDPATNQTKTRMFINDVEVDPTTRQPLAPAAAPAPAPQPAPAPKPAPVDDAHDDTVVES